MTGRSLQLTDTADRIRHFRDLDEPQRRVDASEAVVRAAFAVRGVTTCVPDHDNAPYDPVIDVDDRFYRVQVETAYETRTRGTVQFETRSTRVEADWYERENYEGKIDLFAVYDPYNDRIYVVPVEEAPSSSMFVRHGEAATRSRSAVNWYADYLIDAALTDL